MCPPRHGRRRAVRAGRGTARGAHPVDRRRKDLGVSLMGWWAMYGGACCRAPRARAPRHERTRPRRREREQEQEDEDEAQLDAFRQASVIKVSMR